MSEVIKASQITGEYQLEDIVNIQNKIKKKKISLIEKQRDGDLQEKKKINSEAEEKASQIIQEAKEKALKIEKSSAVEIEKLRKEAINKGQEDGYEQGYKQGQEEGLAELKKIINFFDNIIKEIKNRVLEDIDDNQQNIIKLAFKIAQKILNSELKIHPELINNIVLEMLNQVADIDKITVHINPICLKYISEEDFNSEFAKQSIDFIADSKLDVGDCIVETYFGGKDGIIENKLKLLEKELLIGAGFDE